MKKIKLNTIIALSAILFISNCFAQTPVMQTVGHIPPESATYKKTPYTFMLASNEDEVILGDLCEDGIIASVYNPSTLKLTGTFFIKETTVNDKDPQWIQRVFSKDKITTFYSYYDKSTDRNTMYGKITDRKNKVLVKEQILMQTDAKRKRLIGNLQLKLSADNSKILVFYEPEGNKVTDEKYSLSVYDSDLKLITEKKLSLPYKNKTVELQDIIITNEGAVAIVSAFIYTKKEINEDPELGRESVIKIFGVKDNEVLSEIVINSEYILGSCNSFVFNNSGKSILMTGYFMKRMVKKNITGFNGIYYLKLNTETWQLDISEFSLIDDKTMTSLLESNMRGKHKKEKADEALKEGKGLTHLLLKNVFFNSDGSAVISGQVEYHHQVCSSDGNGNTTCHWVYHNDEILDFYLDKEGKLISTYVIPKVQTYGSEEYIGSIALFRDQIVVHIYNDAENNYNPKKIAKADGNNFRYTYVGGKEQMMCYVSTDKKGNITKKSFSKDSKSNIVISPDKYSRLNDSTIICLGEIRKQKGKMLLKISI